MEADRSISCDVGCDDRSARERREAKTHQAPEIQTKHSYLAIGQPDRDVLLSYSRAVSVYLPTQTPPPRIDSSIPC